MPLKLKRKRKPSPKQVEANRHNAQKSTGPRTPEGKARVGLNALKHGLHADPFTSAMLAIGEKPHARNLLLAKLVVSLRPANFHQTMQVEDIARLRWEQLRLERARIALVQGKMRQLDLDRDHRLLEFDCDAPDLPQAELLDRGLDRAPDSPAKFEKMLSCFDVLIDLAKQGNFTLDPEPELSLLYGQKQSLEGAYLRNVFRRFVAAAQHQQEEKRSAEAPAPNAKSEAGVRDSEFGVRDSGPKDSPPSEQERLVLLKTLFGAKQRALRRYQLYNREFVEITSDQRDACFAPSDEAEIHLMRKQTLNERQLRMALKLYWQTQKEDAAQPGGEVKGDELAAQVEELLKSGIEASGIADGRLPTADSPPTPPDPSAAGHQSTSENRKSSIGGPESRTPNPDVRWGWRNGRNWRLRDFRTSKSKPPSC